MRNLSMKFRYFLFGLSLSAISFFSLSFDNYAELSKHLEIFATLFKELNIYYVDDIKPGDLTKTGIDAMLESLDPYTNYISEEDIEDHRMSTTGMYGGIGAVIRKSGDFVVISEPYENAPATKAGLMAGDILIAINGNSTEGKTTDDVVKLLRGAPHTTATLTVDRNGVKMDFTITREEIKIKNVPYYGMLDNNIGYIKLRGFTDNAGDDVKKALNSLKADHPDMKGVVLDLRGNPGGLLREAINVVNVFVPKNQMVVSTRGKVDEWNKVYPTLNNPADTEIPLVVLVNDGSASASEIVSGTFQDLDRGVIVGQRSFGKGLVQTTRQLIYNTQLKLTTSKYYIPSGRCIQEIDYSHRTDGEVSSFADSLRSKFKTSIGRTVYDGGGVFPDVSMKPRAYSSILRALLTKNVIFDFATQYQRAHTTIADARTFDVDDALFSEFMAFVTEKDHSYVTESEKALEKFKEKAIEEKYFESVKEEYEKLVAKEQESKKEDILKYKEEIKEFLAEEIISRYYYQSGRIQGSLVRDAEVKEAINILNDESRYKSILSPEYQIKLIEYDYETDEEVELLIED